MSSDATGRHRGGGWRRGGAALVLVGLAAAGLRLAGAGGELWLDEIWSLEIARDAGSPWRLLESRHDNNHLLNSAWLQAVGETRDVYAIRGLSLAAGLASLAVVAGLARSRAEAGIALLLFGASYPFVLYGSEARGYAAAVFFALLAYAALLRHLERPRARTAALFSVCGVLGPLAHLTYVHFELGALLWSAAVWWRSGLRRSALLRELARCHAAPGLCIAWLALCFARGMTIAGGPDYSLAYALARASALMLALPAAPAWLLPSLGLATLATLAALAWLAARRPVEALGLGLIGVGAPALVILVTRPPLVYPRYFLVSLAFVLLLWIRALAGLYERGGAARAVARVLVAAGVAGHLVLDVQLARHGRSQFGAALAEARSRAPVARIAVGSDPISRTLARFHAPPPGTGGYASWGELPESGVEWLVLPALEGPEAASERSDRHGNLYRLAGVRPVARESGFATLVYRAARFRGEGGVR